MKQPLVGPNRAGLSSAPCAAEGCQHLVQPGFLMCLVHWRMVPRQAQRDVWTWYRLIGRRPDARHNYQGAVRAAVDAVYTKQLGRQQQRDAATPPLF